METIVTQIVAAVNDVLWNKGLVLLFLLLGSGVYFSVRTRFVQVRCFGEGMRAVFGEFNMRGGRQKGGLSSFQALTTAIAAQVGTGNIIGACGAILLGGPGAIFWMWIIAFFGMATKYSEGLLAIKYRSVDEKGEIAGGPMFYIRNGMGEKWKPLATFFAVACILVAFLGIGTFPQVNAIVDSMELSFGFPKAATDAILTFFIAAITIGGLQSIARVASGVIPFMAFFYVAICIGLIVVHVDQLPAAVALILEDAFTGQAAVGGFAGSTIMMAMQNGIARGVFSNESGLGSAPIAAAAAKTKWPAEQGLISMTGTFIDTIVICTMTGLSIVITGAWQQPGLEGVEVTSYAFQNGLPIPPQLASFVLMVCLVFFAFTTILGWDYYSERCLEFLLGSKEHGFLTVYRWLYIACVFVGPYMTVAAVWNIADIVNGLMAIPNMIALFALNGVVVKETKAFFAANKHKI